MTISQTQLENLFLKPWWARGWLGVDLTLKKTNRLLNMIREEDIAALQERVSKIEQRHPLVRFFYRLFNISNYRVDAYKLVCAQMLNPQPGALITSDWARQEIERVLKDTPIAGSYDLSIRELNHSPRSYSKSPSPQRPANELEYDNGESEVSHQSKDEESRHVDTQKIVELLSVLGLEKKIGEDVSWAEIRKARQQALRSVHTDKISNVPQVQKNPSSNINDIDDDSEQSSHTSQVHDVDDIAEQTSQTSEIREQNAPVSVAEEITKIQRAFRQLARKLFDFMDYRESTQRKSVSREPLGKACQERLSAELELLHLKLRLLEEQSSMNNEPFLGLKDEQPLLKLQDAVMETQKSLSEYDRRFLPDEQILKKELCALRFNILKARFKVLKRIETDDVVRIELSQSALDLFGFASLLFGSNELDTSLLLLKKESNLLMLEIECWSEEESSLVGDFNSDNSEESPRSEKRVSLHTSPEGKDPSEETLMGMRHLFSTSLT